MSDTTVDLSTHELATINQSAELFVEATVNEWGTDEKGVGDSLIALRGLIDDDDKDTAPWSKWKQIKKTFSQNIWDHLTPDQKTRFHQSSVLENILESELGEFDLAVARAILSGGSLTYEDLGFSDGKGVFKLADTTLIGVGKLADWSDHPIISAGVTVAAVGTTIVYPPSAYGWAALGTGMGGMQMYQASQRPQTNLYEQVQAETEMAGGVTAIVASVGGALTAAYARVPLPRFSRTVPKTEVAPPPPPPAEAKPVATAEAAHEAPPAPPPPPLAPSEEVSTAVAAVEATPETPPPAAATPIKNQIEVIRKKISRVDLKRSRVLVATRLSSEEMTMASQLIANQFKNEGHTVIETTARTSGELLAQLKSRFPEIKLFDNITTSEQEATLTKGLTPNIILSRFIHQLRKANSGKQFIILVRDFARNTMGNEDFIVWIRAVSQEVDLSLEMQDIPPLRFVITSEQSVAEWTTPGRIPFNVGEELNSSF